MGPFTQVSRLGMPLINEVIIPSAARTPGNASNPAKDSRFLSSYQTPSSRTCFRSSTRASSQT